MSDNIIQQLIRKSIQIILLRFEANNDSYPYIDTKFDIVSGRNFGEQDEPFRRKECIYSWIQGRGMESLAKHILFFRQSGDNNLADRLTLMLLKVTEKMEEQRERNNGRLPFAMHLDGTSFFPSESDHANFSDLFYSKGLFAAAQVLECPEWEKESERLFTFVLNEIKAGVFHTDQQCFDPKNKVSFLPGKFPQGPRMISLGGIADFMSVFPEENLWSDYAEKFITFICEHHINSGQYPDLQDFDFIESLNQAGNVWRDGDMIFCDPGHALEFVGLASKCLLILQRNGKKGKLISSMAEILPALFCHIFDLGFNQTGGGICKGYDLVRRCCINSDMPWWNLPETVRAGMKLTQLFPGILNQEIALRTGMAFQAFIQGYLQPNGFGCQTRDAQGRIVNVIPAVPDADPGYHTNLSLMDGYVSVVQEVSKHFWYIKKRREK